MPSQRDRQWLEWNEMVEIADSTVKTKNTITKAISGSWFWHTDDLHLCISTLHLSYELYLHIFNCLLNVLLVYPIYVSKSNSLQGSITYHISSILRRSSFFKKKSLKLICILQPINCMIYLVDSIFFLSGACNN